MCSASEGFIQCFQRIGPSPSPCWVINYNSDWTLCWRDLHPLEWQLASLHTCCRREGPAVRAHPGSVRH